MKSLTSQKADQACVDSSTSSGSSGEVYMPYLLMEDKSNQCWPSSELNSNWRAIHLWRGMGIYCSLVVTASGVNEVSFNSH